MRVVMALGLVACGAPGAREASRAEARDPQAAVMTVAGVRLQAPAGCTTSLDERGGKISCPKAVLEWLHETGNAVEEVAGQIVTSGAKVTDRFDLDSCRLGVIDGRGLVLTVDHNGRHVGVFVCVVPSGGRFTMVRCLGYDPRRRSVGEPAVPAPCDQVVAWQPILTARRRGEH